MISGPLSNLLKNRFKSLAHPRPADTVAPPLSWKCPEICFMFLQTSLTFFCWSWFSIFLLKHSLPSRILYLRSFWTFLSSSLSPDQKALFFLFSRAFSSGVTHGLLFEKHCIFLVGTVFSTQFKGLSRNVKYYCMSNLTDFKLSIIQNFPKSRTNVKGNWFWKTSLYILLIQHCYSFPAQLQIITTSRVMLAFRFINRELY